AKHDSVVHAYVTYSRYIYERLLDRLPHRADTIFHLPFGIQLPAHTARPPRVGPLRLVYAGRLDRHKGIYDLPEIDRALAAQGVDVQWTIAGGGPDGDELAKRWTFNPRVRGRLPTALRTVARPVPAARRPRASAVRQPPRSAVDSQLRGAPRALGDETSMKTLILCGGLGTRLAGASGDLPKPMVPVGG